MNILGQDVDVVEEYIDQQQAKLRGSWGASVCAAQYRRFSISHLWLVQYTLLGGSWWRALDHLSSGEEDNPDHLLQCNIAFWLRSIFPVMPEKKQIIIIINHLNWCKKIIKWLTKQDDDNHHYGWTVTYEQPPTLLHRRKIDQLFFGHHLTDIQKSFSLFLLNSFHFRLWISSAW